MIITTMYQHSNNDKNNNDACDYFGSPFHFHVLGQTSSNKRCKHWPDGGASMNNSNFHACKQKRMRKR